MFKFLELVYEFHFQFGLALVLGASKEEVAVHFFGFYGPTYAAPFELASYTDIFCDEF